MDIARIAQTGQSYLYTNVGGASNWTQSALGGSQSGTTSGVAAMDYDWDGAVDVLVTKQSGSVFLIRNTNTVSYGTSLHLRITDPNGINVYYGNTVKTVQLGGGAGRYANHQPAVGDGG
ncbi:putative adhesin for cattle intestine colonization [Escherichia coli]|nr:putative adhesin for cattle intestine colonization [Escherichia coli]